MRIFLPIRVVCIVLSSATQSKFVQCLATCFAGEAQLVTVAGALACHRELRMPGRKRIYAWKFFQRRGLKAPLGMINTLVALYTLRRCRAGRGAGSAITRPAVLSLPGC